ncbi:hypothetical protein MBLNU459_g7201t1 [Dothideomycetes sp. NU459]
MSEVDARPAPSRGRSSTRGGRGGYSRGGPRGAHRSTNGTSKDTVQIEESIEDQGELGDMKKQYSAELSFLKDMFPDWTEVDLNYSGYPPQLPLFAPLSDMARRPSRLLSAPALPAPNPSLTFSPLGHVSQFADVQKKTKDRARSKAKDSTATAGSEATASARGTRGRGGFEGARGGRARGGDRGRGGFRGARGGHAATDPIAKDTSAVSVPTTESPAWGTTPAQTEPSSTGWETTTPAAASTEAAEKSNEQAGRGNAATSEPAASNATSESTVSAMIPEGVKKTWASMFAKPKAAPIPAIPRPAAAAAAAPPSASSEPAQSQEKQAVEEAAPETSQQPEALAQPEHVPHHAELTQSEQAPPPSEPAEPPSVSVEEANTTLAPSNDPLTEDNLENLPDVSHPPATLTAASTVGSLDPRVSTPLAQPQQQAPIGRPPMGGYAANAYRTVALPGGRSASFQRRVLEQQEAVVMPGHNAVDRAAVQFGSMGLNGDAEGLDVDDDKEEPETRTQPPQQSPPSQPRASLPPAPRHEPSVQESLPTPKQAPGLPPAPQHQQDSSSLGSLQQEAPQVAPGYGQYARYGQTGMQQDTTSQAQKTFDPFSHQAPSSAFDQYGSQPSAQQHQQGFGAFSSAPSDYSHYYTADQQRNAYQSYYGGSYGQQNTQTQDTGSAQQRSSSGFGTGPSESAFSAAQGPQQSQSRYGEAPGSGHNTPNPSMSSQQQSATQSQQIPQQPQQQSQYGYPYGHPYYNSPYHAAYQNQFGYNGQPGYGGPSYGKGQMYGQPHGYGMPSSFDHTSSPANAGGFGQTSTQSRESGLSSGLGDYGRSSTQPSQLGSSGFGGMSEPFGRTQSGFQGQSQGYGQQQSVQQSAPQDDLKPFGESKPSGPSPALGQPGRPGSAANSVGGQAPSSTLPPPQSHQQGFSGYPGFNQGSQYGGLGGLGGQSHQQQGQYGQYGGFGNSYGNYGRGGWGGNYGGH